MEKFTHCFIVFLIFISSNIFADETIFKVPPYMLYHTDGKIILNFQLNTNKKITLIENNQIFFNQSTSDYLKNTQYQVNLKMVGCGEAQTIQMISSTDQEVLFEKNLLPKKCFTSIHDSDQKFVFGFISDTQEFLDRHTEVARVINYHQERDPMHFMINGGDVVQTGDDESEWAKYFLGAQSYLKDIPQIAAVGNHDYRGSKGFKTPALFQKYMRWPEAESYGNLFYDFPKLQLVILNSNFYYMKDSEERYVWNWLKEKFKNAHELKKPIIVATHFPVYSSSLNKITSLAVIKMKLGLEPLMKKYKVPLLLSGHTHMYERSEKDGITYLVSGPAGGKPNSPSADNPYRVAFDQYALTFTKLIATEKKLLIETYNQDNQLIDTATIEL